MSGAPVSRFICFHKQKTSARTRFLRMGDSVLAGGPLPPASRLRADRGSLQPHPAAGLRALESRLGLDSGALRPEAEFHAEADTPDGRVVVVLAEFTAIDPPFAAAEAAGGRFIAITEARDLPEIELALLRRAYETILG